MIKKTARLSTIPEQTVVDMDNPWPGLLAYREVDQNFFHGREVEIDELYRIVMRKSLSVFFGLSGLGKTSLLQAGLFPRLRQKRIIPIYIRLGFSPDHPGLVDQIKQTIASETTAVNIEAPQGKKDETLWEYFHRKDADFWNDRNRLMLPLLVFDQFEELFAFGRSNPDRENDSKAFIKELGNLVEGRPPSSLKQRLDEHPKDAKAFSFGKHYYKILISLREDFVPELEGLRDRMPSVTNNLMRLHRMNGAAALQVVNRAKHLIEPQIAEQVVRFVAATEHSNTVLEKLEVEPALLSVVCHELNNKRQKLKESRITKALLKGSQKEVLGGFYERSVSDFRPEVRAFIEEQLLTVTDLRDSVALENALSLSGLTHDDIDRMVNRRLIRIEERAGRQRIELTHDLLTGVIANSRDKRQRLEAGEQREKEIIKKERQQRQEELLKIYRRKTPMGSPYDFERFLIQHPRQEWDRRRLNIGRAAQTLLDLRATLEDPLSLNYVPPKSDNQLLLATWNIQHFGSTERYDESLWYIAEILSRFDLIAIQEVKQSLGDLELVTHLMGPWWKYIVSDLTVGDLGNKERLAYLFDNRKIRFSGLAGESVLPPIEDAQNNLYPARQLVSTPHMAGFKTGLFSFVLSTFHLILGEELQDFPPRVEEIEQLTDFLVTRKSEHGGWSQNMILLGDFNLFDPDGIAARALMNSGFTIPHGRYDLRTTNVGKEARFYDQISFLLEDVERLNPTSLGVVDCFDAVYSDDKFKDYQDELRTASGAVPANLWRYYRNHWRRKEMSDHLLLWIQLPIDFSNIHLSRFFNP